MCVLSIELIWVQIYGKGKKNTNSGHSRGLILVQTVWYRYHKFSGQQVPVPKSRYRYPMFYFGLMLVF